MSAVTFDLDKKKAPKHGYSMLRLMSMALIIVFNYVYIQLAARKTSRIHFVPMAMIIL